MRSKLNVTALPLTSHHMLPYQGNDSYKKVYIHVILFCLSFCVLMVNKFLAGTKWTISVNSIYQNMFYEYQSLLTDWSLLAFLVHSYSPASSS